jgi:type I restriction enzyme M protein
MFPTTSIPVAILVFDRSREKGGEREVTRDILFIDASREFVPGKTRNSLSEEHFDRIISTVIAREDVDKYSHLASIAELSKNDFNLNIPRYVDTLKDEEEVDVTVLQREIDRLEIEITDVRSKMKQYLKELCNAGDHNR